MYNEKFFECQLQGRVETITRAVCFSPRKPKIFADYSGKSSLIKVKSSMFRVVRHAMLTSVTRQCEINRQIYPDRSFK